MSKSVEIALDARYMSRHINYRPRQVEGQIGEGKDAGQIGEGKYAGQIGEGNDAGQIGEGKDAGQIGEGNDAGQFGEGKDAGQIGEGKDAGQIGEGKDAGQIGEGKDAELEVDDSSRSPKRYNPAIDGESDGAWSFKMTIHRKLSKSGS
nr:hypothetical protein BgiMline_012927 [Biomphalaria glabrata]